MENKKSLGVFRQSGIHTYVHMRTSASQRNKLHFMRSLGQQFWKHCLALFWSEKVILQCAHHMVQNRHLRPRCSDYRVLLPADHTHWLKALSTTCPQKAPPKLGLQRPTIYTFTVTMPGQNADRCCLNPPNFFIVPPRRQKHWQMANAFLFSLQRGCMS